MRTRMSGARRWSALAFGLSLALVAAACGDDRGSDGDHRGSDGDHGRRHGHDRCRHDRRVDGDDGGGYRHHERRVHRWLQRRHGRLPADR
jgi:hypothetical protein